VRAAFYLLDRAWSRRKARQAKLIRRWKPWQRSTGPKTPAGKAIVARNPYKGGTRPLMRQLAWALGKQ